MTPSPGLSKTPALDHFCRDLTQLAAEGQLDPTIGRQKEIQRVMEILARELGIPQTELTKNGGTSRLLTGRTKEEA